MFAPLLLFLVFLLTSFLTICLPNPLQHTRARAQPRSAAVMCETTPFWWAPFNKMMLLESICSGPWVSLNSHVNITSQQRISISLYIIICLAWCTCCISVFPSTPLDYACACTCCIATCITRTYMNITVSHSSNKI